MNRDEFIQKIAPSAVADMHKTGIMASLTIAQAALESSWGRSAPGNNLFGIKGPGQVLKTREFIDGQWITVDANFRTYPSWTESIADHSHILQSVHMSNGSLRYQRVLDATNSKEACQAIYKCGYATDPNYPTLLMSIIDRNQLSDYDRSLDQPMGLTIINTWLSPSWQSSEDLQQKNEIHRMADEIRQASFLLEPYKALSEATANAIIAGWIVPAWSKAQDSKDKSDLHGMANRLRNASGQPMQTPFSKS